MLAVGTIGIFLTVVILAAWRGIKAARFPWVNAATFGCAIVGFDLFWRFYLSSGVWNAFKLTSMTLDIGTPAIAILGMFAVGSELRRPSQQVASGSLPNG